MPSDATLYRISSDLLAVLDGGMVVDEETGEITADLSDLCDLQMRLEDKLDGCATWLRHMEGQVDAIKAEEKRLAERRKSVEKALQSYRRYMVSAVKELPSERLKTAYNTVSVRHTKAVQVLDEGAAPEELMRVKVEKSPDKKAIREKLMAGGEVPGCALVVNESLNVR